ncbi:MAG TPA: hypothetical protein PL155_07850 [Candidatus Omnitrophota bacterium]|nr:hypothetical protein [Candidatus Omnitrophota bacterium]HPD85253.1 hypothetical protein [Candidatus Omnitrophota bacterium]HRZ04246.1 hypothetical protein [Candidatus Omnitrophota bacterium]
MKKILIAGVVVVLIGLVAAVFGRNILAGMIIVDGIKKTCGLQVTIGKVDIQLPAVSIMDLKIYNPAGFKDRLLADIPLVSADFDFPAFFRNKVHLKKLALDIKEMDVILNEQGKLNVNSLALLMPKPGTGKPPEVNIDEFSIKIGKVVYRGYFPAIGVQSTEFNPNIDETLHDVTNPSAVAADILKKILSRAGISNFGSFDTGEITKTAKELETTAKESVDKAVSGFKGMFEKK